MPISVVGYGCTIYVWLSTTMYDYGCNTESYGPKGIATNDAGLYPWLIRRPVRECVTWALLCSRRSSWMLTIFLATFTFSRMKRKDLSLLSSYKYSWKIIQSEYCAIIWMTLLYNIFVKMLSLLAFYDIQVTIPWLTLLVSSDFCLLITFENS